MCGIVAGTHGRTWHAACILSAAAGLAATSDNCAYVKRYTVGWPQPTRRSNSARITP
jgi:hypothetical protein